MSAAPLDHPFLGLGEPGRLGIIAHRGDSSHAPENTLEAARLALVSLADAWEFDVRLTRDGVPILLHDPSLLRTTDVATRFRDDPRVATGYRAADFDLAEIRELDAGAWFVDPLGGHRSARSFGTLKHLPAAARDLYGSGRVGIPTLTEALALTRDSRWLANVELKSDFGGGPALATATLAAIVAADAADRVLVSSFDHEDLAELIGRGPGIVAGLLTTNPLHEPAAYLRRVGARAYHPSVAALGEEPGPLPPPSTRRRDSALEQLRRDGVPVFVYTVNDAAPGGLADRLAVAGVSGIFTDDPAAFARRGTAAIGPNPRRAPG